MNILVTGCAGHIGSRLSRYLMDQGETVVGYDGLLYGGESLFPILDRQGFALTIGNILTINGSDWCDMPIHAIVHLAAIVGEKACDSDPERTRQINVEGTWEVLQFWKDKHPDASFVFASTCSLYGDTPDNRECDEDSPVEPLSSYAEHKQISEQDVLANGGTVLRFGTAVGWSYRPRFDTLANELLVDAHTYQKIIVFRPDAYRAWATIDDICSGVLAAIRGSNVKGKVYNVVTENLRKKEVALIVRRLVPEATYTVEYDRGDPRSYSVSAERLRVGLKWESTSTVEKALVELNELLRHGFYTATNSSRFRNA